MTLEQMEKLIDALVLANTGWTGDLNGPYYQAVVQARREVEERKEEILSRMGICKNCGCNR